LPLPFRALRVLTDGGKEPVASTTGTSTSEYARTRSQTGPEDPTLGFLNAPSSGQYALGKVSSIDSFELEFSAHQRATLWHNTDIYHNPLLSGIFQPHLRTSIL
jgi:hypothetical protein